jgi:hypothetical protein
LAFPKDLIIANGTIFCTIVASSLHALAADVKVLSGAAHRSAHCPRRYDWATGATSGKLWFDGAIACCRPTS